jgi:hypothetical protein
MQDLRLAIRALVATPTVSVVAALSLALGIGANTALYALGRAAGVLGADAPRRERRSVGSVTLRVTTANAKVSVTCPPDASRPFRCPGSGNRAVLCRVR